MDFYQPYIKVLNRKILHVSTINDARNHPYFHVLKLDAFWWHFLINLYLSSTVLQCWRQVGLVKVSAHSRPPHTASHILPNLLWLKPARKGSQTHGKRLALNYFCGVTCIFLYTHLFTTINLFHALFHPVHLRNTLRTPLPLIRDSLSRSNTTALHAPELLLQSPRRHHYCWWWQR